MSSRVEKSIVTTIDLIFFVCALFGARHDRRLVCHGGRLRDRSYLRRLAEPGSLTGWFIRALRWISKEFRPKPGVDLNSVFLFSCFVLCFVFVGFDGPGGGFGAPGGGFGGFLLSSRSSGLPLLLLLT